MHAEIISIGSELTTGAKLDTNSQWLSLELSAVGIPVHYHTTVADDMAANIAVLKTAAERADIVLITGGLGPTLDDLTRDALAALTGTKLVLHEPSLEIIRGMFARRNRPMPDRNVGQAMFPEGSSPIPNPRGTAPGVYLELARPGRCSCKIAAMPGVPSEMKGMFRDEVLPKIAGPEAQGRVIRHARINCFGLGESAAEEMLGDVTARGRDPEVGITVHEATITLRIVAEGFTIDECTQKIAATRSVIHERLGQYIFGEEDEELQHAVVRMLNECKQTLATAEIGTGGLVAHRLTDVIGAETCYRGGTVLSAECLSRVLELNPSILKTSGPASEPVAAALAEYARLSNGEVTRTHGASGSLNTSNRADWGLAVSACSQRDDSEGAAKPPVAFIALSGKEGKEVREINLAGDPAIVKSRLAKAALNLLRLQLLK